MRWIKDALPVWADAGYDSQRHRFQEALDVHGRPLLNRPVRSRVQGRQLYAFGQATELGWYPGATLMSDVFTHGYPSFEHREGGMMFTLSAQGERADDTRYTYEQAFALLGYAWQFRVNGDTEARLRAERLWSWMQRHLRHPLDAGYLMGVSVELPRSQNPHMHLFEACLNWFEASRDDVWLERARPSLTLFQNYFFDYRGSVILEFFPDVNAAQPDAPVVDPGHQLEWIWLLGWYGQLAGQDLRRFMSGPFSFARKVGMEPRTGLPKELVRLDGTPIKTTSRVWAQTEHLKALLTLHRAGQDHARDIQAVVDDLFRYHLDPAPLGLWVDVVDGGGVPVGTAVPASTLYHLMLAIAELWRVHAREDRSFM